MGDTVNSPLITSKKLLAPDADIEKISLWLKEKCRNTRALNSSELARFENKKPLAGWVVPLAIQDKIHEVFVVLPNGFPWLRPIVYSSTKFKFRETPHIEKDGSFCLYNSATEHDPLNPTGLVAHAIREAGRLIQASSEDDFQNEFLKEFGSYWKKSAGGKNIISLLLPNAGSRSVKLWRGQNKYYLADDAEKLSSWLEARYSKNTSKLTFDSCLHIALQRPLLPKEYPKCGKDIISIVDKLTQNDLKLLLNTAENASGKFTISFEAETEDGPIFFAIEVLPPVNKAGPMGRKTNQLNKGFRPGKLPPHIKIDRILGQNNVEHHATERADPAWVHGRDAPLTRSLFKKSVLMIGVGSLGSEVAQLLAKSGIQSIALVDPETLDFHNVGRHALGISDVKTSKAQSLAQKIKKDYPHLKSVKGYYTSWEDLYEKQPEIFFQTDLIISTVGSWIVEGKLNQEFLGNLRLPPILYGWAEAFAVAGQAVLVGHDTACLSCGLDHFGKAIRPICQWEIDTTHRQPECGAIFQPYGPVSITQVAALVAQAAIKFCLGTLAPGTASLYWAPLTEVEECKGTFSCRFLQEFDQVPMFGGIAVFDWPKKIDCSFCRKL